MNVLLELFSWGSPLGLGIFLVCIGLLIYLLAAAGEKGRKAGS